MILSVEERKVLEVIQGTVQVQKTRPFLISEISELSGLKKEEVGEALFHLERDSRWIRTLQVGRYPVMHVKLLK